MYRTRVWFLVWEDSTCCETTEPVCYNYWARGALESMPRNKRSHRPQLGSRPRSLQLEKAMHSSEDPVQPQTNALKKKKKETWELNPVLKSVLLSSREIRGNGGEATISNTENGWEFFRLKERHEPLESKNSLRSKTNRNKLLKKVFNPGKLEWNVRLPVLF